MSAADIIYFAGFEFNDIDHNLIIDLGSGTGRLSIASAYLRANQVIGIDFDWSAIKIFKQNINELGLNHLINPICTNVSNFEFSKKNLPDSLKITTIMNPPFGVQKRTADRAFLLKAFNFSDTIYTIHLHNEKVHEFLSKFINNNGWKINYTFPFKMILEKTFPFHSQKKKDINVKIYRITKK
ncbi:MAG: METTL5 family protein [Promethearchaeota archaeon]